MVSVMKRMRMVVADGRLVEELLAPSLAALLELAHAALDPIRLVVHVAHVVGGGGGVRAEVAVVHVERYAIRVASMRRRRRLLLLLLLMMMVVMMVLRRGGGRLHPCFSCSSSSSSSSSSLWHCVVGKNQMCCGNRAI